MSEADNVWRVEANGTTHEVEVEVDTFTSKINVTLDGEPIGEDRLWFSKKRLEFSIGGRPARVTVENTYGGFSSRSKLHVDNRYVEPLPR